MKKIPNWAIYLADIMCVISALLIAGTYYYVGLPMDTMVALLCVLMVLSATAIICTSQIVDLKISKLGNPKSDKKQLANIEENFQVLFKQVSAIKKDNATLNANFSSLLSRFNDITKHSESPVSNEKILADFTLIKAKIEELDNKFAKESDLATLKLELDESFENLRADVELDLGKLDDIDKAVKELKQIIEELSETSMLADLEETREIQEELDREDEEIEEEEDIEQSPDEAPREESHSERFLREAKERLRLAQESIKEAEEAESIEQAQDDEDDGIDPSDDLSQISLMSRALNNTQQSHSILGSFAKIKEQKQKEIEEDDENDFVDIEDDLELDEDLADIMNLGNDEPTETTLTINAMLGLGNKPYIRISNSDLGIQMDFVEIGKWRYIFKDLKESTKVSVWLNDEIISKESEFFVDANDNKEIDINF